MENMNIKILNKNTKIKFKIAIKNIEILNYV